MNRELALSAKKYNFLEKLQQNQYVDAIDDGRWKVAKIIGFKIVGHRHSIRLHFDAFPNSWDEDFDLPASTKLAPFRRFTLPYTGPFEEKKILHRPVPSLNLQAPLSDLRKLTKADKQKIKPQFIIQNFRGELFILVDTFLTQNIKHRPEQFEIVFRFLEVYIEVGIHVLKFALQKFPQISKQYINDPNIIYVNPTYALISSLPQILFNFNSMISVKEKRVKFFLLGEGAPQQPRKKIKAYLKSKDIIAICQTILSFQTPPYRGFSWSIKKQALILLSGLQQQIEFPKITDSRQISDALDVLGYLKLKQAFSEQTIQNINIELVLSLILSGNFEGKLKGLAQIKKICEGTVFIKKQIIKEKILSQNLLYALTDNATFNSEVFKRSIPVFEAAARHQLLTDEILKRIINLHKDKHELQLKSYYTTLTQFGSFLNEKKVIQFFEEIKKFAIDTDSIELVKEFTRNVITNHPIYKKKYMSEETGFGLVYLWQVINNHTSPEIVTQAILAFSVLAGDIYYRQVIQRFLVQCFTNIKNGKNIESSLKIIHSCLNKNREIVHLVENIDRQFSIIDILVKSLIEQQSISSKTIESIFEFIEQVNQHARKKITVDHIKDLWMLKQCHRNLLKFLRKYTLSKQQKSNQKIILKKLSPTQIRQIFAKIFLNKQLMNNYMNCDDELFKTIDELLISYNHRSRAIDYNVKHCIRCILPYEVFGVEVFLDIAMGCRDQAIVDKALTRFVQYFIRPFKSKMSGCKLDKIGLWMLCADKINKYMDQSSLKYLGYSIIFKQIQGRMKSINILDPSEASFTVYAKQSNQRKVINIQRCSSLWKLRQIIDYQFKLNKTNFEMFVTEKRTITDMQTEQDFSVAYLESKDSSSVAVVITQSKQPHPHYISIQSFKNEFSQMFAQKIYDNLHTIKGSEIQSVTLQLLLSLPMIKNLEIKTSKLEIGKQITWDQILDVQCKSKLSYQLFVLNKVKTQGIPWVQGFIKKGGVQHIEKILRQRVQSKMSLSIKDYQVLTQLLEFFNQVIQFIRLHQPILPFNEAAVIEIMRLSPKQKSNPALQQDPVFLDYFYLTFTSLKQMVAYYPIDGLKIISNPNIIEVLELLLFTEKITQIQTRFPSVLLTIGQKSQGAALISQQCEIFLSNCESNIKLKYSCRVFFDLLVLLFDNNFVTNDLYNKTLKFIESTRFAPIQVYSEKQNSTNQLIRGWLRICKCLLLKSITDHHQLKCIPQPQQKFADFLIRNGLFGQGHLFENEKSRAEAFDILSQLSCKKHIVENIDKLIVPIITKGSWRRQYQWYVKSFKKRKNNSEVGLKNLAATCYINSMLQQLYHIKQFSQALLEIDTSQIETSENIAYEVQKIFAYLKYSNRQVYTTQGLCDTFISDGQPIDPRIQMDIDQFFHTLMDKLEHNLMKINKQSIIDQVFKGEYSNLIIGQDCQHKSERIQNFLSMRLEIIKKTSLTQALTEFIKGQVLQGENAYFCEKCDKKIKAVKRVCVKSLPQVLILTLKRFQFDFDRMEKFKLNSFCEFDEYLDMLPYMRQSLYDKDEKLPSQNYKYKLKGVVIHYGVSEAGHYTSYIRIQNGEWKYFDDDKISNFDFKQLGNECFGGPDDNPYSDTSQKLKNAYLLIYERVNKPKAIQNVTSSKIKAEVDAENLNNQQIKVIFDQGLQTFFDTHAQVLGKTYILFVHLVSLRSQKRSTIYKRCYENCVSILQKNPSLIQWYLEQFSENLIKELLIFSHPEVSNMVASIITYCVGKHFNADFIKRCMKCIDRKNMMALCKVFQASAFNPAYGKVLAEYSFGEKIFKIIKQDKAPNQGSLSKLQISRSQFGQPYSDFYDKKDMRNSIELIECIQFFKFKNFPQEEVEPMIRRAKKFVTQIYLAKFIASKFRDDESVQFLAHKIIFPMVIKFQPKFQEQYMFRFVIILMAKMCEIKDQGIKRRAGYVAELYLLAIKQSLDGYKAMRYLILGLFSLAFNNQVFREEFINVLNSKDNKKYVKSIRDWMKEADRFYMHVKSDKMGYWRRIGRSSYAALERMDADPKISSQKYLSLFNSLLERHKIDFPDLWAPNIRKGQTVQLSQFAQDIYQVVDKFGLILHLKSADESERYILEDDVFPIRSI